MLKVMKSS